MKLKTLLILPLMMPLVSAEECSITNLGSCLVEKFFEFLLSTLNAPIQPLLDIVYSLLTKPVNTDIFSEVWGVIVYILSMFYGLLLLYVGFRFILSGYSPEQREKSKTVLANIIIMMVLVQASYFLYSLINEVVSSVTTVIFNMVQKDFFLLTIDNVANIGLELALIFPYLTGILITLILLVLRYMIVSIGVIFFAIGIFFYFIEPLNNYGKLIINFLLVTMCLPFFYSIIFLASSKLLEIDTFQDLKILVMIGAFAFVNIATIIAALFVIIKAALKVATPIMRVASVVRAVS